MMSAARLPPSAAPSPLAALIAKKEKLEDELRSVEKQVYDLETSYLTDSSQCGNVLKGFEGFLASNKSANSLKRPRKFQPEDRLFSLSSTTSPVIEEAASGREADGKAEGVPARSKGTPANGPGKQQKRGRTNPREGKRIKQVSEQEQDDEEELEGSLR